MAVLELYRLLETEAPSGTIRPDGIDWRTNPNQRRLVGVTQFLESNTKLKQKWIMMLQSYHNTVLGVLDSLVRLGSELLYSVGTAHIKSIFDPEVDVKSQVFTSISLVYAESGCSGQDFHFDWAPQCAPWVGMGRGVPLKYYFAIPITAPLHDNNGLEYMTGTGVRMTPKVSLDQVLVHSTNAWHRGVAVPTSVPSRLNLFLCVQSSSYFVTEIISELK